MRTGGRRGLVLWLSCKAPDLIVMGSDHASTAWLSKQLAAAY